jgi:hypothetical protein
MVGRGANSVSWYALIVENHQKMFGGVMFRVTVDGEVKEWLTFEFALTDALARGLGKLWTLEKVSNE